MTTPSLEERKDELIRWKTDAWKDPNMVAWYSQRMFETSGWMRLHNFLETSLCEQFAVGPQVLDVGIGTGRGSLPLLRRGLSLTGVDSSQAMLDETRRQAGGLPITLIPGDVLKLPVADGAFDTVMALNVMTHFPHWQPVLREWSKKARKGGRIFLDIYSLDHLRHVEQNPELKADDLLGRGEIGHFNMHLTVDEIVRFADEAGLRVAGITPYGGLYSSKFRYFDDTRSVNDRHWWQHHLSWIASDAPFFEFCLFLEQHLFSRLTSRYTGRFMMVLDNTPDPAGNASWKQTNDQRNRLLGESRLTLDSLAPLLALSADEWRARLHHHLGYTRNRVVFFSVLAMLWRDWRNLDLATFLSPEHVERMERWHSQESADRKTMHMVENWYTRPEVADTLTRDDTNLGQVMEYELSRRLLTQYFHAFN